MHRISQRQLSRLLLLGMILGSCRGYVALYRENAPDPQIVYPYRISSLPPADQQALEKGIPVRSEKELQHLLEDFLS